MSLTAQATAACITLYRDGLRLPLLTQNAATDKRPFIHPLLAPDGVGELTENEPGHHLWQHGLYVGLNDINGVGFWTEGLTGNPDHDGTFHPQPLAPPTIDAHTALWTVITQWRSPVGAPMLTETQNWSLEDRGDTLVLDLEWTLQALIDLRFGKHSYGGLFLRMPWRAETTGTVVTSEGVTTHTDAEGKRARWIALSMPLPGRTTGPAGVAILDHPINPEHPAPWRVDNNLGIVPSRCIAGEWHLAEDAVTTSRYRVFAYTGVIDRSAVESEWQRFAFSKKD